jgi:hypothetical protein
MDTSHAQLAPICHQGRSIGHVDGCNETFGFVKKSSVLGDSSSGTSMLPRGIPPGKGSPWSTTAPDCPTPHACRTAAEWHVPRCHRLQAEWSVRLTMLRCNSLVLTSTARKVLKVGVRNQTILFIRKWPRGQKIEDQDFGWQSYEAFRTERSGKEKCMSYAHLKDGRIESSAAGVAGFKGRHSRVKRLPQLTTSSCRLT